MNTAVFIPPPPRLQQASAQVLLTPQHLHEYQKECVLHQLYYPDSMLWLQMGLGKTAITLTTIVDRMRAGQVKKVLIFGPLRVIQAVWEREARKWSHTKHLRFSVLHGAKEKRTRALFADADIFLCNYESMNWLAQELDHYFLSQGHPLPMQMVVYDEVSKLKNSTTKRMAGGKREKRDKRGDTHAQKLTGWRKMINEFHFRIGLTGTPASNGYIDLHGQYLAVDGGERLGEFITHYRDSYFESDYNGWKYSPTAIGREWIEHKISDITKKMDAKDYLDMPAVKIVNMMVTMPDRVREAYRELEKQLFTKLDSGTELELFNKASLSNKCLQFCNGSAYRTLGQAGYELLHQEKLDALEEVIEEAGGHPVLCSYSFVSDAERIMEHFKKLKPVNLTATKSSATGKVIDNWNAGRIKLLIGHPASMGHGIDGLQQAGHILVWFGLPWSLELYNQMNSRLDRQGQANPVSIIRILCNDSVDLAVADAIERKQDDESGLKAAIDRYRKGYTTNDLAVNFY
jgi:SNF2 family DNA or RNA helicase